MGVGGGVGGGLLTPATPLSRYSMHPSSLMLVIHPTSHVKKCICIHLKIKPPMFRDANLKPQSLYEPLNLNLVKKNPPRLGGAFGPLLTTINL